jgi:hypothetical protein|tara:strand:- start:129 stop:434 length:306 start_codon:yes stop_codon:yes gene_type:complete
MKQLIIAALMALASTNATSAMNTNQALGFGAIVYIHENCVTFSTDGEAIVKILLDGNGFSSIDDAFATDDTVGVGFMTAAEQGCQHTQNLLRESGIFNIFF